MTSLPPQPSFEQLRKQAKTLLDQHHGRNPECCRVLRHLHQFAKAAEGEILSAKLTLADVQFALAIEYGCKTWGELKERASRITPERAEALLASELAVKLIGGAASSVRRIWPSPRSEPGFEVTGTRGTFIVRFLPPGAPPAGMRQEQRMGELLASLDVTAPQMNFVETPETTVAVYRKIEGENYGAEMTGVERARFVEDMASLLIRLHAVPLAEACKALGIPVITAEEAARRRRPLDFVDCVTFETNLAADLAADATARAAWQETRSWYEGFPSRPEETIFSHGDLHSGNVLIVKSEDGWRLAGVVDFQTSGIINLYDDFLRIIALDDGEVGDRIIAAYNAHPECRHPVSRGTARRACCMFAFYLAANPEHQSMGEQRRKLLGWAMRLHASAGAS